MDSLILLKCSNVYRKTKFRKRTLCIHSFQALLAVKSVFVDTETKKKCQFGRLRTLVLTRLSSLFNTIKRKVTFESPQTLKSPLDIKPEVETAQALRHKFLSSLSRCRILQRKKHLD
jgi:hypothetical protein